MWGVTTGDVCGGSLQEMCVGGHYRRCVWGVTTGDVCGGSLQEMCGSWFYLHSKWDNTQEVIDYTESDRQHRK